MSASLDGLPGETQLQIFHLLVPEDPNDPDRHDLANLRSTCKAIRACATSVYFEHHYMLIRQEGDTYYRPRSYDLFLNQPELAALVKTVWVAHAVATPGWLRGRAAFDSYEEPSEVRTLELAYMATDLHLRSGYTSVDFHGDSEIQYRRRDADFTSAQYNSIKTYYRQYIAPPAYADKYGAPTTSNPFKELLERRLRTFSKVNLLRFVRPPIIQTPFHEERYAFWMANGLEEWAYDLSKPREGKFQTKCFPWHPQAVGLSLDLLPSTCTSLELDVLLYRCPFAGKQELALQSDKAKSCFKQLQSLVMLVETPYSGYMQRSPEKPLAWARFVNQFCELTDLSLCHSSYAPGIQDVHRHVDSEYFQQLLAGISLPSIRRLNLESWVLDARDFKTLRTHFPNLEELRVRNLAIAAVSAEQNGEKPALWHMVASYINHGYDGKCALRFDMGPYIERQGYLEQYGGFEYCIEDEAAITRVLKVPAQEILTAISQAATTHDDLSSRYFSLMKHKRPATVFTTTTELYDRKEEFGIFEPYFVSVETPAMTFMYYEVLDDPNDNEN